LKKPAEHKSRDTGLHVIQPSSSSEKEYMLPNPGTNRKRREFSEDCHKKRLRKLAAPIFYVKK
jgi:hypothetical protein